MNPVRIGQWAGFGALVAFVISLILSTLGAIGLILLGLPLGIALLVIPVFVIISVIAGAIGWAISGIVYDLFLFDALKDFSVFWQIFLLSFFIAVVTTLLQFQPVDLIMQGIGSLFGTVIVYGIVVLFGISTPFD